MAREKTTTFFSRNLVKIQKTSNIDFEKRREPTHVIFVNDTTTYNGDAPVQAKRENGEWVETKVASKLGFYYKTRIWKESKYVGGSNENNKGLTIRKITVNLDTEQYTLSYPTQYAGSHIGIEERPWDIAPGSKGMDDHFIDALVKEVSKFFDVVFDNKINISKKKQWYERNGKDETIDTKELKKKTFIDLFGYEDGPKIQPNNIKILAHGFDLKESFRKRKENK